MRMQATDSSGRKVWVERVQTVDSNGFDIEVDVSPHRVASWRHYLTVTRPDILGFGAGDQFGRRTATDAAEAQNFAVNQLAYIESKEYATQIRPQKWVQLVGQCVQTGANPGAATVEYTVVEDAAKGRRQTSKGDDIPMADTAAARVAINVAGGAIGYELDTQEIRTAAFTGRPIQMRKENAAQRGFMAHLNDVALVGETASGFTGLYNNASVPSGNRPSGAVWDSATADTIIADITAGITAVAVNSKEASITKKVALPLTSRNLLLKPRSTNSDTSILGYLAQAFPGVEFISDDTLATLGGSSSKRAVFFDPDDENMVYHLPMMLQWQAPQYQNLKTRVVGEYRYGGFEVRRVKSAYYMDGL